MNQSVPNETAEDDALLRQAQQAARELNAAQARLAEALQGVKGRKLWKGEHTSLSAYLADELHVKPSAGNELIRVADALTGAGVSLAEGEAVGFHKLAIVQKELKAENKDAVLRDARELKAAALKQRYAPAHTSPRRQAAQPNSRPSAWRTSATATLKSTPVSTRDSMTVPTAKSKHVWEILDEAFRGHERGGDVSGKWSYLLRRVRRITQCDDVVLNMGYIAEEFLKSHPEPQESTAFASGN